MNIKFLEKKLATKTFEILPEAYGDETLSREHVFERHKWFPEIRDGVEEDERAGSPSCLATSTLVRLVEREDRWDVIDHHQGFHPQNWGGTEQNLTVTCMVLKAKANDRRKNSNP
ncbi:hypothetical protein TNCV_2452341 [Trichonephila clavipes]|nr:hypothetical protein TNCV_2452341 [Trichonephila clavipes]